MNKWFDFFVYWHINLHMLFNSKAIHLKEQQWCYLMHSWEDKAVHTFPKGICSKVNVVWLESELTHYDPIVQCCNHYTTRTLPWASDNHKPLYIYIYIYIYIHTHTHTIKSSPSLVHSMTNSFIKSFISLCISSKYFHPRIVFSFDFKTNETTSKGLKQRRLRVKLF